MYMYVQCVCVSKEVITSFILFKVTTYSTYIYLYIYV